MAFNPDSYLAKKGGFDPDAYLAKTTTPEPSLTEKAVGYAKQLPGILKEEGRGALNAVSFGKLAKQTPEQQFADESMVSPEGTVKTTSQKLLGSPYKVGQTAGSVVPIIASELAAGAAMPLVVAKYGLNAVQAAIASGALTGGIYEGLKGAVQGKPPVDTTVDMAKGAVGFGGLGAVGYGMGKVGKALTEDVPEGIANQYLNPPSPMAQAARRKGKDSMGKEFLDRTQFGAGSSKDDVYNAMSKELENNRLLVRSKLEQADEAAKTASGTYEQGPLGEQTRISPFDKSKTIDLDEIRAAQAPILQEQKAVGKPMESIDIAPGEKIVSNSRAYQLLGQLDAEVNNAYLKTPQNIPPGTEARAIQANALRAKLAQNVPEVSQILNRNHFLQNAQTALLPQVSGTAPIKGGGDFVKGAVRATVGNRAGLGLARGLQSPVTQGTSEMASEAAKQAARLGIADYIDNLQKGNK